MGDGDDRVKENEGMAERVENGRALRWGRAGRGKDRKGGGMGERESVGGRVRGRERMEWGMEGN